MANQLNNLNSAVTDFLVEKNHPLRKEENDRAIATFTNMAEIENAKSHLKEIIKKWIAASQ